jgi:hypothetical protein
MHGGMALDAVQKVVLLAGVFLMAAVLGFLIFPLIPALRDLFRGGPRPPSHPLPSDDSRLLNRRRMKSAIGW